MLINILLPHKEKFSQNKASSVSITVRNNLKYTKYKKNIKVFGQKVKNPLFKKNFYGIENPWNILKSKNLNLAMQMCNHINKELTSKQVLEIHNRPYLIKSIKKKLKGNHILSLFFHNNPIEMKGSMTIQDRKELLSNVDKIYCVSEFIKKKFLQGICDKEKKVVVLYNGVLRKLKSFPSKKKEVIFVGRIVKEKGVDLLVNAISHLSQIYSHWHFKIIGSPKLGINKFDDFFSKQIQAKIRSLNNNVSLLGYVSPEELELIMSRASIIVIPSVWEEPFGLVAAEAMANGVAIISSERGALPEIIQNNGMYIKNFNEKEIISKLEKLMINKILLNEMQKNSWNNFKMDAQSSSKQLDSYREELF